MKKDTTSALVKNARKSARKELETNLRNHITEMVAGLGYSSKKVSKEINKASKQLARNLSEKVRVDKLVMDEIKKKSEAEAQSGTVLEEFKNKHQSVSEFMEKHSDHQPRSTAKKPVEEPTTAANTESRPGEQHI